MEKKFQIFISSTQKDLIKAREEVTKVILNMYHIPIGMEMFSADNADQWDTIQETIDNSDYYVLIIGHRYGSETKEGISYTEKEFDYAKENGVPIYTYVRDRNISTLPIERDENPEKITKLNAFIDKALENSMSEFWNQPSDLGQKISIALNKAFTRRPRIGWVRGDMAASTATLNELAILSKENRELKDEIQQLRSVKKKAPLIKVTFNGDDKIDLLLPESFDTPKIMLRASYEYPRTLNEKAYKFYIQNTVDRYNKWIDENPEAVEVFNNTVRNFERSKRSFKEVVFGLENKGNTKAIDINISISFPKELIVYPIEENFHLTDLPYPEKAPKHPTVIAHEGLETSRGREVGSHLNKNRLKIPNINFHSLSYNIDVKDQTVFLHLKDLLHTQSFTFDQKVAIGIMAIKEGEFVANVQIICEEYSEPQEYKIPILVSLA
jgi:hypothetical protein